MRLPLDELREEGGLTEGCPLLQATIDRAYLEAYADYHGLSDLEEAFESLLDRLERVFSLEAEASVMLCSLRSEPAVRILS